MVLKSEVISETPSITQKNLSQIQMAVLFCFFLSGLTALVYEIVWARMLNLVFGTTVFAITTVLAAFMAGLALGSFLFGKISDRYPRSLRLYALLEAGIGIYCLLLPLILKGEQALYLYLYHRFYLSFYLFGLARFLVIFFLLLIPSTFMGGTLPVLSRFFVKRLERLGRVVGNLYGLNTLGAVLGSALTGFILLRTLGLRTTIYLAAIINLGIASSVLLFDKRLKLLLPQEQSEIRKEDSRGSRIREDRSNKLVKNLVLIAFALSGFTALVYEVIWTRTLSLILGSSIYAFATMLTTFLLGLGAGSLIFSFFFGQRRIKILYFALVEIAIGLCVLLSLPLFEQLPIWFLHIYKKFPGSWGMLQITQFFFSSIIMLIPTLLFGATLPIVSKIYTQTLSNLGRSIGTIYSVNTVGAIIGSVSAGFLFIPFMGCQNGIILAASVNLVLGCLLLSVSSISKIYRYILPTFLIILMALGFRLIPHWDREIMSAGVYQYAGKFIGKTEQIGNLKKPFKRGNLVYYKEGLNSTVTVNKIEDQLFLTINGKVDASNNTLDMTAQLLVGHLPLLFHKAPQEIMIIGLGSGVTAGAVAQYPVRSIDCAEIEPAVVEAAKFFNASNRNVLEDSRLNLIINDGRNHLLATEKRYDVIISEPSNPWIAGISNLYTKEFYLLAKARLNKEGIICQWVQSYGIFPDDFRMIINTFCSVFPYTTVWSGFPNDILLIGAKEPFRIDYQLLEKRICHNPTVKEQLTSISFPKPHTLFSSFILNEEEVKEYTRGARINTDDLPLLEFSAPKSLYREETINLNYNQLMAFKTTELPPISNIDPKISSKAQFHYDLAMAYKARGLANLAIAKFEKAIALNLHQAKPHYYLAELFHRQGMLDKAVREYKIALNLEPDNAVLQEVYQEAKRELSETTKITE